MKSFHYYSLFLLLCLVFTGCNDNINDVGTSIQPEGDKIVVSAANFNLSTENFFIDRIYNRPDSFLLGRFDDNKYGIINAEILAQFNEPFGEGIAITERFPDDKEGFNVDSTKILLYFNNWFGSDRTTMRVKAYRMNKNGLDKSAYYPSNINPLDYVDINAADALIGEKVVTATDYSGEGDSIYVSFVLDQSFSEEIFQISKTYTSQDDFLNQFKGLYLTTDLGDATMMDIYSLRIFLYYSFPERIEGRDTIMRNSIAFNASPEINQVNIFTYPDREETKTELNQNTEYNYIASPANVYTKVTIPMRQIISNLQDSVGRNKSLIINSAAILAEVVEDENTSDYPLTAPTNMLLLQESEVDLFFSNNQLTNDSVIASSFSKTDSCYTFNIGSYITKEISRLSRDNDGKYIVDNVEDLNMVMIPVVLKTSTNYYGNTIIDDIKQQTSLRGATIRSGTNSERNMIIRVIASGF